MAVQLQERALAMSALAALQKRPSVFGLPDGSSVQIPADVFDGLLELLRATSEGDEATVVRTHRELTTQQAAKLLNVSRPTIVRLIEEGVLVSRRVGSHRRVSLAELLLYRDEVVAKRREALDEMMRDAEMNGLYV
jgi:excisionase family DNA binding protein